MSVNTSFRITSPYHTISYPIIPYLTTSRISGMTQVAQGKGDLRPFSSVSVLSGPVSGLSFAATLRPGSAYTLLTLSTPGQSTPTTTQSNTSQSDTDMLQSVLSVWGVPKEADLPQCEQAIVLQLPICPSASGNGVVDKACVAMDCPGRNFVVVSHP